MSANHLLLVENSRVQNSFLEVLNKRFTVDCVSSGKQALEKPHHPAPDMVILNAISLRTSGDRICGRLRQHFSQTLLIHLRPEPPAQPHSNEADALLVPPFTSRKLFNIIERLQQTSQQKPDQEIITCGPFTLDIPRRVLFAHGQETQLRPKLALLVEQFFRRPGVVLEREQLMQSVWDTDFCDDTRTLNVHIRWFRQTIEANPSKPTYLRTVRGIGYCLNVDVAPESPAEMVVKPSEATLVLP